MLLQKVLMISLASHAVSSCTEGSYWTNSRASTSSKRWMTSFFIVVTAHLLALHTWRTRLAYHPCRTRRGVGVACARTPWRRGLAPEGRSRKGGEGILEREPRPSAASVISHWILKWAAGRYDVLLHVATLPQLLFNKLHASSSPNVSARSFSQAACFSSLSCRLVVWLSSDAILQATNHAQQKKKLI